MSDSNNKISNLINSQVPFFVRNDHPNFIRFLEAYYEFLEQEGREVDTIKNLQNYYDIDKSVNEFLQKFYETFVKFIPQDTAADKTMVLKQIKDFYRARGTEKSMRLLMRLLYNQEIEEFYYPKSDILRASDGKWFVEKSIKVNDIKVDGVANNDTFLFQNFENRIVRGNVSNAFATVESADSYYEGGTLVRELKISNQVRKFNNGEEVFTIFEENGVEKRLSANLFSGAINTVRILNGGSGYKVGDQVVLESNTGTGAVIIVSSVATGNLKSVLVLEGGAGFRVNDQTIITSTSGIGANAYVASVTLDSTSPHPNSYNIVTSTIALEANTPIGNAVYSNLNSSNVNTVFSNAVSFFTYANTGPVRLIALKSAGNNYIEPPKITAVPNTAIRALGILGGLKIVNGGLNYSIGDTITFTNVPFGYGTGAAAVVSNVAANGRITAVRYVPVGGQIAGGSGYQDGFYPLAKVNSANGNGANLVVSTLMGGGESLLAFTTNVGPIQALSVISPGFGYNEPPTLNLQSIGDGTAQANSTIISGTFTYPGRFLNDDGIISSYNFLQDRDYYQNFSYVIKVNRSIDQYRKAMMQLVHPSGMKMFGEYLYIDNGNLEPSFQGTESYNNQKTYTANYVATSNANGKTIIVTTIGSRNVSNIANVYLEFSANSTNLFNGIYQTTTANATQFRIYVANTITSGTVTANNGNGNTYILTGNGTNFNVLSVGDTIRIAGKNTIFYVASVSNANSLMVVGNTFPSGIKGNTYSKIFYPANSNGTIYYTSI